MKLKISKEWAMPNKNTFTIKPIKNLIMQYVKYDKNWIDPFARDSNIADISNDINPESKAKSHVHAVDFCTSLEGNKYNGVLFDPPYSLRQVKECYDGLGLDMSFEDSKMFPINVKNILAPKIKPNGIAISFGWDSTGFGKGRGFEQIEILLVCHGGRHNDTIITVERKINNVLEV